MTMLYLAMIGVMLVSGWLVLKVACFLLGLALSAFIVFGMIAFLLFIFCLLVAGAGHPEARN